MKIYTKTGDAGQTSLFTGERIAKESPRVETYGTIDEANSALAMARAFSVLPEVKQKISKEIDNEQLCKNDSNSIDSDIKNKNTFNPKIRNSEEIPYNSDNKSTSVERPDKSDDLNQQTQSSLIDTNKNNNYQNTKLDSLKLSKSNKKNVEIPHKFYIFLERNEGFQKRQKENINELKRNVEDNIKKSMKEKPEITKKSRIIDKKNSKQKFLDRIQDEANKYKQRKEKLFERINLERAKKKEEIEKPLEFNTKLKEDKKFMKAYESMMERQKEVKNRFNDLLASLEKKYGKFKMTDTVKSDYYLKDNRDWMYAMRDGARTYQANWNATEDNYKDFNGIMSIAIGIKADYSTSAYIWIEYAFLNAFDAEQEKDDVL